MKASKLRPVLYSVINNISNIRSTSTLNVNPAINSEQLKPYDDIPGPKSLPIIGQLHHFLPGGDFANMSTFELALKLYEKFGPIVKLDGIIGRPGFVFLFDPESCSQVLRSENLLPARPGLESLDYYRKSKGPSEVGYGLVTDAGEVWKKFRSTVNPAMLQPKTIKLYSSKLDEVAQEMIKRLRSLRREDSTLDTKFDMEMNLWALESIGLVALGRRLNCFDSNLPADSPEKRLITVVHDIFKIANELDLKPSIWKYYPTKTFKKAMKLYKEQEDIARFFVDKTIEELNNNKGNEKSKNEKGVLEKLLEINKEVAVIMASDMLFAGVDTTSNTIMTTLYLLANNQDKQDKLREEILSPGEKRSYLRACIKESLRMMPVVSGNARTTTKDYALLGYHIPKGTPMSLMHQAMSPFEDNFPQPLKYIPERWITDKEDPLHYSHTHPFVYNPFGFGARSCIGRRIAELELETFLSRLIQNFKLEWFGEPLKVTPTTINYASGPYNFRFKDV